MSDSLSAQRIHKEFIWCIMLTGFHRWAIHSIPEINTPWSWYMILLIMLLKSVCQEFVEDFCIYAYGGIGLWFSLLMVSLSGLVSGRCWPHRLVWEVFPFLQCFGEVWEILWKILKHLVEFTRIHHSAWALLS
jgi:hypothetical protein